LLSPRAVAMVAPLPGGDVLVIGGCDIAGCTSSVEVFEVATRTWRQAAPLATARGRGAATALADGRVLVTGGCATLSCTRVLDSAELYDPVANTWTSAGTM